MAQDNEHIQKLIAARQRGYAPPRRRGSFGGETKSRRHGNMREAFIKIQDVIKPSSVPSGMRDISPAKVRTVSPFGFASSIAAMRGCTKMVDFQHRLTRRHRHAQFPEPKSRF